MKSPRSTTPSPESARAAAAVLVALSALSVVTCATATRAPPAPVARALPPVPPKAPDSASEVAGSASAVASAEAPPAAAPVLTHGAALARFQAALRDAPHRSEPVRILWLGDSHTAADFWPDSVRRTLQSAYGCGGPGFIYLGLGVYRHGGVKITREGKWRVEPRRPSLWIHQNDGVFGLGGVRAVPEDAASTIRLELSVDAVHGKARWDVAYRLPTPKARFSVGVEGGESHRVDATTGPVGSIAHLTFQTERGAAVVFGHGAGEPELFGAIVESSEPGVVVDSLGVNGARVGTPLAWEEGPWVEQAKLRAAALIIMAYGTNETGDEVAPFRYGPQFEALLARAREASPGADCLIAGPTEREGPGWVTMPRVHEIDEVQRKTAEKLGCSFVSVVDAMGGEGGMHRWAEMDPPLGAMDRVHLTPRGYAEIGAAVTKTLLEGME